MVVFALLQSAEACLQLSGSVSNGFQVAGNIVATDNGVQTCSGGIKSGDNNGGLYKTPLYYTDASLIMIQHYSL